MSLDSHSINDVSVEDLLKSKFKIERDKGVVQLKRYLLSSPQNDEVSSGIQNLSESFLSQVSNSDSEWEPIQGCLFGLKCIVENVDDDFVRGKSPAMRNTAQELLTHDEVRVRLAAGELLGALCKSFGADTYIECSLRVLELIRDNLNRDPCAELETDNKENGEGTTTRKRMNSVDAATIYHESAGWRYLETSMKCLQYLIEGCGKLFNPYVTQELLDLIFTALSHENRFVRETGYYVCASLVNIGQPDNEMAEDNPDRNSILKYGDQFSQYLAKGLADNWSQVRLASSTAARYFLMSVPDKDVRASFYPLLLPRICLNRYYVADGVRIYTQETWKKLSEGKGRDLVETYIDDVVDYYARSTQADNHAVREAACACIAELGNKIRPSALKPHVDRLLKTLLECFKDDSWPVRDSACVACGNFIVEFGEESIGVKDELYALFLRNLQDPIASVRQGAAGALANFVKAYAGSLDVVLSEIREGLRGIEQQPENTEKYTGLDKSPAQFGVAKRLRDNDVDLHSNQTMYSCGSLAPKMGRGRDAFPSATQTTGSRGGCSDCRFQRPSEPWERSDGCVCLLSELLSTNEKIAPAEVSVKVSAVFPDVVKAAGFRQYSQHIVFLETVCRQLPIIATRMGRKAFKPHLELFFEIIFYALNFTVLLHLFCAYPQSGLVSQLCCCAFLDARASEHFDNVPTQRQECDTPLTSTAAEDCLVGVARILGPSILRGRIEAADTRYLEAYDRAVKKSSPICSAAAPGSLTPFPRDMDPFANVAGVSMPPFNLSAG